MSRRDPADGYVWPLLSGQMIDRVSLARNHPSSLCRAQEFSYKMSVVEARKGRGSVESQEDRKVGLLESRKGGVRTGK